MLRLRPPTQSPEEPSALIECAAGKFQLWLRRPSFAERMEDEGLGPQHAAETGLGKQYARQQQRRLEMAVVGWNGVQDARGESLPYSPAALADLLTEHPDAIAPTMKAVASLFQVDRPAAGQSVPLRVISPEMIADEAEPSN